MENVESTNPIAEEKSALFAAVKKVFAAEGWDFHEIPGRAVIQAGFEAHHTRVELHVQAFPALNAVSVVSESPLTTSDPAQRERFAELVLRANQNLTVGNFEMDWDTGRVLFRATNLFPSEAADPEIVRGLVHTTILEMDRLSPLLVLILQASGPALAGLNLPELMSRLDLLPGANDSPGGGA
ncbi:MAG: YbjN domain-containing protein [Verrucomicrobiae bacterium]|nr:YbjN domain-containing protein [Verrucomicrobiae bacterium]